MENRYDVLIIGAGLSGIGMACHLTREAPGLSFAILERRKAIGGTWDLFRYPGVRSDSDMFSFGYDFRPWNGLQVLADGPSIRRYIEETARQFGVDRKIRFGLRITEACWSGTERCWTLKALAEETGEAQVFVCRYLIACTGYYDYDEGYLPHFPGVERYRGRRIHPQHWPEGLDWRGKRIVVVGSGATAVTLVPALAGQAAHVTMLQRSPGYLLSVPSRDKISAALRRILPDPLVYGLARKRNIALNRLIYKAARRWPQQVRRWLLAGVRRHLGADVDMRDFTPRYLPWDERLCVVPDADLFDAIRRGKASVVTDGIETFTERGIRLESGRELEADIVVTATGLKLQSCGGIRVLLDGRELPVSERMTYKGVLVQDVPNCGILFGYTNAPWTLKADLAARYLCRLFEHMRRNGLEVFTPRAPAGEMQEESVLDSLRAGYIRRAQALLPRQGRHPPWRVLNDFAFDRTMLLEEPVADAALEFLLFAAAGPAREPARAGECSRSGL